jgi:hypothetical protein
VDWQLLAWGSQAAGADAVCPVVLDWKHACKPNIATPSTAARIIVLRLSCAPSFHLARFRKRIQKHSSHFRTAPCFAGPDQPKANCSGGMIREILRSAMPEVIITRDGEPVEQLKDARRRR